MVERVIFSLGERLQSRPAKRLATYFRGRGYFMDDLHLGIAESEQSWRTDTETADAIGSPAAFQIATAWSISLPAELVQRFAYKSAPTLFAAIIIHSQARDVRQYSHIVPLEHFQ